MKNTQRFLSLLLAVILIGSTGYMCSVSAQASTPTFEIGSYEAVPGDIVQVPIAAKSNPGIAAVKLKVSYDTTRLELTSVTYGSWSGSFQQPQRLTSPVSLTWYNGAENYTVSDSTFATLTFRVLDDAPTGEVSIRMAYDPNNVYNIEENNIAFDLQHGSITVKSNQPCSHSVITTQYTDNKNGTHTATAVCSDCKAPVSSVSENCADTNRDNKCDKCNAVLTTTPAYTPTFEIGAHNGTVGKTIQVPILVKHNPGIAAVKLKVAYDSSRLELTAVEYGVGWNGSFQQPQRLTSPVSLTWYNGAANYTVADSTFATLTFHILDTAQPGEAPLQITYDPNNVYNIEETNIEFAIYNGIINVIEDTQNVEMSINEISATSTKIVFQNTGTSEISANFVVALYDNNGKMVGSNIVPDELDIKETTEITVTFLPGSSIKTVKGFVFDIDTYVPILACLEKSISN